MGAPARFVLPFALKNDSMANVGARARNGPPAAEAIVLNDVNGLFASESIRETLDPAEKPGLDVILMSFVPVTAVLGAWTFK